MGWIYKTLEIMRQNGEGELIHTRRWRMTAEPDIHEAAIAPYGDLSHDHGSAEEAAACDRCDEFMASLTGRLSRRRVAEIEEERDRQEYERLSKKYGKSASASPVASILREQDNAGTCDSGATIPGSS